MIIGKLQYNNSFSEVEKELAQYILEHPETVVEMNIRQLAQASFSSPATITRLCRKIGAKGFTDFKVKLSGELHSQETLNYLIDVNVPFQPEDSMEEIAKKLAEISLDSIRSTRESFHYGRMENIVRCIMKSSVVDVYGEGDSLYAAFEFKNKMMRIRRQVRIEMGGTQQSYQAINSDPSHCAILISHSGESRNVIRVAKALKKRMVPTILITSEGESTLCTYASYIVRTGTKEKRSLVQKLTTYSSQTAVHYILDCLFSFIYVKDYYENWNTALQNEKYLDTI